MRRKLIYLVILLLVLILFSGFFWFYEARYLTGRANVTQYVFSIDNSYLFVTPLQAKANGEEKVRITVVVLNNQGLGVLGRKVSLGKDPNLITETVQGLTDDYGKAVFDVMGNKAGDYYLDVVVDNTLLPQKAHLSYN